MQLATIEQPGSLRAHDFHIRFPEHEDSLRQDEEWFEFVADGRQRRLRIHDYAEMYRVPGLYEALVYDRLQCRSPQRLANLLVSEFRNGPQRLNNLRVLDLGAGNGVVAAELRKSGVTYCAALDLIPEAKFAAQRDRPDAYDDYAVVDLCSLSNQERRQLQKHELNCLVTAAALGFGDIPPRAFAVALNLIDSAGWLGLTIKENFLEDGENGFARLVGRLLGEHIIEIQARQRYCHRLSIGGEQLFYVAIVARKRCDIPDLLVNELI